MFPEPLGADIDDVPPQALPASHVAPLGRIEPERRHQLVVTDRIEHSVDGRFDGLDVEPTTLKLGERFRREGQPRTEQFLFEAQKAHGQGIVTPGGARKPEDQLGGGGEGRQRRGDERRPGPPSRKVGQQRRDRSGPGEYG